MSKCVAETSRAAWADLQPSRAARASGVLEGLRRYRRHVGRDPTAYELLRFLQIENPRLDHNSVRPRLTELRDAGCVATSGKRVCAVTGKRVYVWTVVTPRPLAAF